MEKNAKMFGNISENEDEEFPEALNMVMGFQKSHQDKQQKYQFQEQSCESPLLKKRRSRSELSDEKVSISPNSTPDFAKEKDEEPKSTKRVEKEGDIKPPIS